METVLLALLSAAIKGGSAGAIAYLEGLTLDQELTFGVSLAAILAPELAAKLGLHEPSPEALIDALLKGAADDLLSKASQDWFAANGAAAIERNPGIAGE